ncbi:hypothetical protein BDC45DRAFT_562203 [Circinella umbellata]|nr:hypothetical protein BDC45DRAFT_562203 [Circinella umbellata]
MSFYLLSRFFFSGKKYTYGRISETEQEKKNHYRSGKSVYFFLILLLRRKTKLGIMYITYCRNQKTVDLEDKATYRLSVTGGDFRSTWLTVFLIGKKYLVYEDDIFELVNSSNTVDDQDDDEKSDEGENSQYDNQDDNKVDQKDDHQNVCENESGDVFDADKDDGYQNDFEDRDSGANKNYEENHSKNLIKITLM